ncbi:MULTISPECIES: M91 family zinc metallopeptidase [Pseudomonas]|uniref:Hemolysin n=2 Tax=Pseudomonas reactans TaxID=117680 RepID=A0A7Y8KF81_9PSED|nr:M91 family zinc metallopeptidase [Pseudomonas reactans]NWE86878.1 hemolysin [Pseudomonas reactans]
MNIADFSAPPPSPQPLQDPIHTQTATLLKDANLHASRVITWHLAQPVRDTLLIETGDRADVVHVSKRADGQVAICVNGRLYTFPVSAQKDGPPPLLHIKTQGGNDSVKIDSDVRLDVKIEAGDGHDDVQAGGGATWLYGGSGHDTLHLADGTGYAEGNEGDDLIIGGTGSHVMYGNDGNDRLYAGPGTSGKQSYLDGGRGDDRLYAGKGHTVINGGRGNDVMVGHDRTTFYTGLGRDTVFANGGRQHVFGKPGDRFYGAHLSTVVLRTPSRAGAQGLHLVGSAAFRQRVADDLDMLRSSPNGQAMLREMDAAAARNGAPVTIREETAVDDSQYVFGSEELTARQRLGPVDQDDPINGVIRNGRPGSRATQASIAYNRSSLHLTPGDVAPPITSLYHELAHAYNGANGTFLPGITQEGGQGDAPTFVANDERQAVGLPTDAQPFDFDNDPATPATTTNPMPFNENALNAEMGRPLRTRYSGTRGNDK